MDNEIHMIVTGTLRARVSAHLTSLQTRLTECVEAGQNFGRDEGATADRTLGIGAGETSATQRGGGET